MRFCTAPWGTYGQGDCQLFFCPVSREGIQQAGSGPPAGRVLLCCGYLRLLFLPYLWGWRGSGIPREWVLLDQQPRRIRWQVAYTEQARWCPLFSTAFLHPREQVAGGPIPPRWLIERVELLDRDLGAQCSQA